MIQIWVVVFKWFSKLYVRCDWNLFVWEINLKQLFLNICTCGILDFDILKAMVQIWVVAPNSFIRTGILNGVADTISLGFIWIRMEFVKSMFFLNCCKGVKWAVMYNFKVLCFAISWKRFKSIGNNCSVFYKKIWSWSEFIWSYVRKVPEDFGNKEKDRWGEGNGPGGLPRKQPSPAGRPPAQPRPMGMSRWYWT